MRIAIAVAMLSATGCKQRDSAPSPAAAPTAPVSSARAPAAPPPITAAAPAATDSLELLDPGREPRAALRYHVSAGTTSKLAVTVDAEVMGETMPTMTMLTGVAIDEVLPDGGMKVRFTIDDVGARDRGKDGAAAMLGSQLAVLKQTSMGATLSPTGGMRDPHLEAAGGPPELVAQMRTFTENLQQLALPLPTTPVGVGARWRSVRSIVQGGMTMTLTATVGITAIDGDRLTYHMTSQVSAPRQVVAQGGMTVTVDHLGGSSSGDGSIDLATFAITGKQVTAFTSDMISDGATMRMDAKMTLMIAAPTAAK